MWKMVRDGQIGPKEAFDELANIRDAGVSSPPGPWTCSRWRMAPQARWSS